MNRRELFAGAAGLIGQAYLPSAFGLQGAAAHVADGLGGPPKNLLSSTYTPDFLAKHLLAAPAWHPYPRVEDRAGWLAVPQDVREAMIRRAEALKATEWPSLLATTLLDFKRNGNRTRFEAQQFGRRHKLTDLVLGECAAADGRFVDAITDGVWLICEETFWGAPAHLGAQKAKAGLPDAAEPIIDLFAAETAATMAWVTYLLGSTLDRVSPLIVSRIRMEAKRRVLDPALERNDFGWMGLMPNRGHLNNWNPWINSNWLTTNLLLEEDPARRVRAVSKICRSLDEFLGDYSPDGGCEEGPVYWQRSAGSFFDCCWTLASAIGGAASVLTHPFVRRMGHYIADVHIAGNSYVNYGDAHMEDAPSPELVYRYGAAVADKELRDFGAFHSVRDGLGASGPAMEKALAAGLPSISRSIPDILSAATVRGSQQADALGRDSWYPALKLMTARAKGGTTEGFYLAVQAASNGRSHGHNDSGSFIVFHDGEPVFIDVGVEAYTARTFSPERYNIWTMQSAYHNLPTVGGVMQHEGSPYQASDVKYATDNAGAGMTMNLATAYPAEAGIVRWTREIVLDRSAGKVRLIEEFALQRKVPVVLSLMTSRLPSGATRGSLALRSVGKGGRDVSLAYDPSLVRPSFEKIAITDEGLQRSWGKVIYRVLLSSVEDTSGGRWAMEISQLS